MTIMNAIPADHRGRHEATMDPKLQELSELLQVLNLTEEADMWKMMKAAAFAVACVPAVAGAQDLDAMTPEELLPLAQAAQGKVTAFSLSLHRAGGKGFRGSLSGDRPDRRGPEFRQTDRPHRGRTRMLASTPWTCCSWPIRQSRCASFWRRAGCIPMCRRVLPLSWRNSSRPRFWHTGFRPRC